MAYVPGASGTRANVVITGGDLFVNGTDYGAFEGGISFDPGEELRDETFDGMRAPVSGLRRVVMRRPVVRGRLRAPTGAQLQQMTPGATGATVGGVLTITPMAAGEFIPKTAYVSCYVQWKRGDGTRVRAVMPEALIVWESIDSSPDAAGVPIRVEGALDDEAVGFDVSDSPYYFEIHPAA